MTRTMFDIQGTTAKYNAAMDAESIALAALTAKQEAIDKPITEFVAEIPNSAFGLVQEITRLVAVRPLIDACDAGVRLTYKLTRTVSVSMSGAATSPQSVPDTLDLAHRRVVGRTENGIESI